ncbi:6900_t:CDS:1, partial [Gigaspora margarita]
MCYNKNIGISKYQENLFEWCLEPAKNVNSREIGLDNREEVYLK